MMRELDLFVRQGCHLCDEFIDLMNTLTDKQQYQLTLHDVDDNPEWVERYGTLVPVLLSDGNEICHYFFDLQAFERYFRETIN